MLYTLCVLTPAVAAICAMVVPRYPCSLNSAPAASRMRRRPRAVCSLRRPERYWRGDNQTPLEFQWNVIQSNLSSLNFRSAVMMTPAERAARHVETVLRNRDFDGLRDLLTPGFTDHSAPPGAPAGPDGYVQFMRYVTETLGITYDLDDVVSS